MWQLMTADGFQTHKLRNISWLPKDELKREGGQCVSEKSYPKQLTVFRLFNTVKRVEMKAQVLEQFEIRLLNAFRKQFVIKAGLCRS